LEGGNPEEINKIAEQLSDEETVEYAALSDLAFLSLWHDQFNKTLEAVSTMKQELIKNQTVVKVDKDGKEIIGPIGLPVKSTMLNSITQAEHRIYHDMRKNLNIEDGPEEPKNLELSELDKDDLKKLAAYAAKEIIKNE